MMKKAYIKPETEEFLIQGIESLLAGSDHGEASQDDDSHESKVGFFGSDNVAANSDFSSWED